MVIPGDSCSSVAEHQHCKPKTLGLIPSSFVLLYHYKGQQTVIAYLGFKSDPAVISLMIVQFVLCFLLLFVLYQKHLQVSTICITTNNFMIHRRWCWVFSCHWYTYVLLVMYVNDHCHRPQLEFECKS